MDINNSNRVIQDTVHPDSNQKHRQQIFYQIYLPLGLFLIMMIAVIVNIIFQSSANPPSSYDSSRIWANISTIFLIILNAFGGLIILAILMGMIYLILKLLNILPIYSKIGQKYIYTAFSTIYRAANQSVKPVISIQGWLAGYQNFLTHFRSDQKSDHQT